MSGQFAVFSVQPEAGDDGDKISALAADGSLSTADCPLKQGV